MLLSAVTEPAFWAHARVIGFPAGWGCGVADRSTPNKAGTNGGCGRARRGAPGEGWLQVGPAAAARWQPRRGFYDIKQSDSGRSRLSKPACGRLPASPWRCRRSPRLAPNSTPNLRYDGTGLSAIEPYGRDDRTLGAATDGWTSGQSGSRKRCRPRATVIRNAAGPALPPLRLHASRRHFVRQWR